MIRGRSIHEYAVAGMSLVIVCAGIIYSFNGFMLFDDAFMFTRYADHVIQYGEYSWNVGDGNMYGTTSLAYTFILIPIRLLASGDPSLPLVLSSLLWGMVFIYLSYRIIQPAFELQGKRMMILIWLVCIAWTMQSLMIHLASGMETTFVMAFSCAWLLLFRKALHDEKIHWSFAVAFLGGFAWWVRPDLMLFTLGMPALLLIWKAYRVRSLFICTFTVACLLIILFININAFGSIFPIPFLAKSTGLYGEEIRKLYSKIPWVELLRMGMFTLPVWVALIYGARNIKLKNSPLLVSAMICVYLFFAYYLFFVLQIMGYGQRFYFPVLPFVFYSITEIFLTKRDEQAIQLFHNPIMIWACAIALVFPALRIGKNFEKHSSLQRLAEFDSVKACQETKKLYWIGLVQISKLPDDLVIATTEVGFPSALNPRKKIVDISGLNDIDLILHGLNPEYMAQRSQPDVIYFPHPDYTRLLAGYYRNEYLKANYKIRICEEGQCMMDVAIRQSSRYFSELDKILEESIEDSIPAQ